MSLKKLLCSLALVLPVSATGLAATPIAPPAGNDTLQYSSGDQPTYLHDMNKQQPQKRAPASGKSETQAASAHPQKSGYPAFELNPSLGAISIFDKSTFTMGLNFAFRLLPKQSLYFEPSFNVSFLGGDLGYNNMTVFHIDAGLRYDLNIKDSAVVPFLKVAVGPSIASNSNTLVNGRFVPDSYFNLFAGGGIKVNIDPSVSARLDVGYTLQDDNGGIYAMAGVGLPL